MWGKGRTGLLWRWIVTYWQLDIVCLALMVPKKRRLIKLRDATLPVTRFHLLWERLPVEIRFALLRNYDMVF
jgi:hypothetical protein